jgi:hypothetical protein
VDLFRGLEFAKKQKLPFTVHPAIATVNAVEDARARFFNDSNEDLFQPYPPPQFLRQVWATIESYFARQKLLADWGKNCRRQRWKTYVIGESRFDAYWQTLATGMVKQTEGIFAVRLEFRQWRRMPQHPGWLNRTYLGLLRVFHAIVIFVLSLFVLGKLGATFQNPAQNVTWRRLVRTKTYIGLATCTAREGDWIALVKGSKAPLVIRAEGGKWRLKRGAYAHGIMGGERFQETECKLLLCLTRQCDQNPNYQK